MTKRPKNMLNIFNHLMVHDMSINIHSAMTDYGMSGGSLTKTISRLRKEKFNITRYWITSKVTGHKWAEYKASPEWFNHFS